MLKSRTILAGAIAAALSLAAPFAASASPLNPYGSNPLPNPTTWEAGVIRSVHHSSLTLHNGTTVAMNGSTIVRPYGKSLKAGERVEIKAAKLPSGKLVAISVQPLKLWKHSAAS